MADKPIQNPLPANLPENWTVGQIVAPAGADVGLSQQHGYNYLMEQVNAAQEAVNTMNDAFEDLAASEDVKKLTASDISYTNTGMPSVSNVAQALDALQKGLENGTITAVQVTAAASGWSGSPPAQSLTVAGMTADSLYWVGLNSTATYAQRDAARKAVLAPTAQGAGTLTLTCDGAAPTVDLPILVFLSGGAS